MIRKLHLCNLMATKAELKKTSVAGSQNLRLLLDGKGIASRGEITIDEVDYPVMPDPLNIVEDYLGPNDPGYAEAVAIADEMSLMTRAYYMQWLSFMYKNTRDVVMRRALKVAHERMCRVPHPFVDENTKKMLKLKEDNYEHVIIKERRKRGSNDQGRKKSL